MTASSTVSILEAGDLVFMLGLIAIPLWIILLGFIFNAVSFR